MQLNALCKNGPVLVTGKPGKPLLTHTTGMNISRQTLLCMKVTAFILLAFCMQVSATTLAQNVTLSEHNAPLEKVINDIKQQTGYSFFYNQDWLQQALPVDVQVKNAPLETALKICFANQPFDYAVVNKTIVLKLKEKPVSAPKGDIVAPANISGKVTDSAGTPLIGATVAIKGSTKATITNEDGEFNLEAQVGDKIVVSYIGFRSFDFTVDRDMPYLNIKLMPGMSGLKEVTVSTGYQTIPKERATGSFVQIDSTLINRRISTDMLSRLEGVVPGLLFNRNTINSASGQIDINIDGHSTINANDQPLIVVDGFAYDGDYNNINPNDVESITVLKDAAAASIWGVRSGNGVIVITTKKGKRNQALKGEINANVTIGNKPDLYYNPQFLDANDFINLEETLFNKGVYDNALSQGYLPVSPVVALLGEERAGTISAVDANSQINAFRNIDVRNDLTKYFYQKSIDQQYNLNLRGGGDKSDYYFSFGDDHNRANLVGNSSNRVTVNSSYNFYPVKNLQISAAINYVQSTNQINNTVSGIATTGYGSIYPYAQLVDKNGNALPVVKDYAQTYVDTVGGGKYLDWNYRPYDELRNSDNTETSTDNRINIGIKYDFLKHFSATVRYEYEKGSSAYANDNNLSSYYTRNLINGFTQVNSDGSLSYPVPLGGVLQTENSDLISKQGRAQLNYNQNWNNKNDLSVIAGTEIHETINESNYNTVYGYDANTKTSQSNIDYYDTFIGLPQNYGTIPNSLGYAQTTDHYISYYSNAAYTYDGRYTFSLSGRIDQSNLFGVNTNQKAVPLYSTGFAWSLSKEQFYHIDWLPLIKLRATYGYTGNIDKTATAVTTIRQTGGAEYSGGQYAYIANPGNPELRWERIRKINLGIDFGTKNNTVSGSIEYYLKKGIDLFGNSPLAPSTGFTTFYGNTADTKGNGVDIVINTKNINTKNFKWVTNFSLSHVVDVVTRYGVTLPSINYITFSNASSIYPLAGKDLFGLYSYKWAGLTHSTGDPQGYLNGNVSTNYAGIIANTSINDMVYNGSSRPTTFGYLRNTFTYKEWSLSANIIYKLDYYFRKTSYGSSNLPWSGNVDFSQRWQNPGDELKTNVPSLQYPPYDTNRDLFYANSSILIDNGDHIRLEDITLSYDLNKNKIRSLPFSHLQLYSYINNVGILWRANKDHLDPDLSTNTTGVFPLPTTFSFGIKANF